MTETQLDLAARITHLAWVAYCKGAGQPCNEEQTEAQRASQINGLKVYLANPGITPRLIHGNWLKYKLDRGWQYGNVLDEVAKTHPLLAPYDALPASEQKKSEVFLLACAVAVSVIEAGVW